MRIAIIGGGISGISAAKVALERGAEVFILEKEKKLGGVMERIANCRIGFKTFFDEIKDKGRLRILKGVEILSVERKEGFFILNLKEGRIEAERIIIAVGIKPYDPPKKGKRILTSLEYDSLIDQKNPFLPSDFQKIGFILCVGSRSKEYPLCSSVCCSYVLREIKWTLRRARPEITVFYNDLRFFGQEFFEEEILRKEGVRFVRANSRNFEEDEDSIKVKYFYQNRFIEEPFNYIVLAIGIRPNPELFTLQRHFGFSLNRFGFVAEKKALTTDVEGIYACGGALEPMSIKDAILTGFGAGYLATKDGKEDFLENRIYREEAPELSIPYDLESYLFWLKGKGPESKFFYEYFSLKFIEAARNLKRKGKKVYVITENLITPSFSEIYYEEARREGVIFIPLEEDELVLFEGETVKIPHRNLSFSIQKVIDIESYLPLFRGKPYLCLYRSEPQLRWSPTKWSRDKYHIGFIRYPRNERWQEREFFGALGEIILEEKKERAIPQIEEERCSGCNSCKKVCPSDAIEIVSEKRPLSIFGSILSSQKRRAVIKENLCIGCGLCLSICPQDAIKSNSIEL